MQPRIYHPNPLKAGTKITLSAQASAHCFKVLRLKQGQIIELFCGDGCIYPGEISSSGKTAEVLLQDAIPLSPESTLELHLAQGLARHDRMDWIVQKAVECGVNSITPLIMEKSIVKFKAERLDHKLGHWQQIIISACEQSGRTRLPVLNEPISLEAWLSQPFNGQSVVFHPNAQRSVKDLNRSKAIRVLLGPESGLSEKEIQIAQEAQFSLCHLGPRILRTETATIAALACLQSHFGDY